MNDSMKSRRVLRRALGLALIAGAQVFLQAGSCSSENQVTGPDDAGTGTISGRVTVSSRGRSGVTVSLREGATTTATTTTGTDGNYHFVDVVTGTKRIVASPGTGTYCHPAFQQVVNVTAGETAIANFACGFLAGSVEGTVTVNGIGEAGVRVSVTDEEWALTNSEGFYRIGGVSSGRHSVRVQPPSGVTCPTPGVVNVPPAGTVTRNIACTRSS